MDKLIVIVVVELGAANFRIEKRKMEKDA